MENFIELGLEAFDHVTDRYHDQIYDGVARVGPWVKEQRARSMGRIGLTRSKSNIEKKVKLDMSDSKTNTANQASIAAAHRSDTYPNGKGRNRDERTKVPTIRVDEAEDDRNHIYPPAPQPMAPPYPTTASGPGPLPGNRQLIPMPPDAPYPLNRSGDWYGRDRLVRRDDYSSDESDDSRDGRGRRHRHSRALRRTKSENGPRRSHSHRRYDDRYDDRDRRYDRYYDEPRGLDKAHIAATLTGAVAGGFIGKEASKGDMMATVAGALVGALGANVAEREWERHKRKEARIESKWEEKWGYRS